MKTLLENMCEAYGQRGGTIHQFVNTNDPLFNRFERVYYDYVKSGITFTTKNSFKKLADYCHIELRDK
jgi:hypothetical protein